LIQYDLTRAGAWFFGVLLLLPAPLSAQGHSDSALSVTTTFEKPVQVDEPIEVRLNRPLDPATERLAVIIGQTDWSGLLVSTDRGAILRRTSIPLPVGEHDLQLYLVSPSNEWIPLGSYRLKVISAAATPARPEFDPTFQVTNKGQVAEGHRSTGPPPRATFQDFGLNGAIHTAMAGGGWTTRMQMSVLGVSNRKEALRVRDQPETAPLVDLADYLISTERDHITISLGHVTFGRHPQLFNAFASRGVTAAVRLGSRADVALSALHGSSIVGWDHVLGFERREHRVFGATVGLEMFPTRPGGLRLEGSWMDGRRLPLTGFNQGRIDDTERSRGGGVRLVATDVSRRFRADAGYARSTFLNPNDALRAQGSTAAPLPQATRGARYVDLSYAVVHEKPVGRATRANLLAGYRHERVDPQYGSVAADLKSDLSRQAFDVRGNVGAATMQAAYTQARDNLDGLAALVKTVTRAIQFNAAAPLSALFPASASANSRWWPMATYMLNRIHQRGTGLQPGPASPAVQLPDQIATDQVLSFDWYTDRWRIGYHVNRTLQDNRQTDSDATDLVHLAQNITVDLTAGPRLGLQMAVGLERAENTKLARVDSTKRVGLNGIWRITPGTVLTSLFSTTVFEDSGKTTDAGDVEFNLEISKTVPLFGTRPGSRHAQLFVRYSRQAGHRIDRVFALDDSQRRWTCNTGFNVTLF
jgi:hypothetical protein